MTKTLYPATLLCDFYKVSHKDQYPAKTESVYSTWIPRSNKYFPQANEVVAFGFQAFVKKYLINYFNEHFFNRAKADVVAEYVRYIKFTLGVEEPDASHIADLHELGYLPITVKAVKEGTLVPVRVPMLVVENTDPRFFWITNYLETLISNEIWLPATSATIAYTYRKILDEYAVRTTGSTEGVIFSGHDFSMRGMGAFEASVASGAGHLLSFVGTDTIPAIAYHEAYYNADIEKELVGTSIPATEHSVMCSYGQTNEFDLFKHLVTDVYPNGLVSIVSDTWDFWKVVDEYLPVLKSEIMSRDGKVVIRPDSGDPVDIICGRNIPDLTDERYPDTKPEDIFDEFTDRLYDMDLAGDGWTADPTQEFEFKLNGKYYKMVAEIFFNRHDKRYYYIDEIDLVRVEEFQPKVSDLGLIEALWNTFGGTVTEQGYKVLDPHIGAIYGDSITLERATAILEKLEEKGFASTNIVFGIGSFTYQYNTRDTFGFAMKATHVTVNGEERKIFKNPKTDDGTKKSLKGRAIVFKNAVGDIVCVDDFTTEEEKLSQHINLLETVFENGKLMREQSLSEIRDILHDGKF